MRIKGIVCTAVVAFFLGGMVAQSRIYDVASPDQRLLVKVDVGTGVQWSASYDGKPVVEPSVVSLDLGGDNVLGKGAVVVDSSVKNFDEMVWSVVPTKSAQIPNRCNELTLTFKQDFSIQFRVFDNGLGYRFVLAQKGNIKVYHEQAEFNFPVATQTYFPEEESFISHYERSYLERTVQEIKPEQFCSLPALFITTDNLHVAITDADLFDYPCMFLKGTGGNGLTATFPRVPLKVEQARKQKKLVTIVSDRTETILEEADYIASITGPRSLPWRTIMVSTDPGGLIENDMVFLLSRPLELADTSWIKPGKVAWDWWNANNVYDVDFEAGINNDTYKYYIDFASKHGLEYIILDEGWSKTTTNLLEFAKDIDVVELVEYGKERNVDVILWALWGPLNRDMENVLDTWSRWGVKGLKVDFMQRADQRMVNFFERAARATAKRKMLIDYHGSYKPSGLRRALPNVISYEGVKGQEHCKWGVESTPSQHLTLPFIRMLAGPMDYTPGAMINSAQGTFESVFEAPMSQGTRAHQVAMYMVYESPLQMLCDTPSNYLKDPVCTAFIAQIPTTWDETRVLTAEIKKVLIIARRKGEKWFVGGMSDWEGKTVSIDLDFLGDGVYSASILSDGSDASSSASDYTIESKSVSHSDTLELKFAPGGGWAAVFTPR